MKNSKVLSASKLRELMFPKPPMLNNWSYSAWAQFKACAFRLYRTKVCGDKEPTNIFMTRGIEAHKKAEFYLKGQFKQLPKELLSLSTEYKNLRKAAPIVEQFWGVDMEWKPTQWGSWVVMKMDAAVTPCKLTDHRLFVQDLKTGRRYDNHDDQASLYAVLGMQLHPTAKGVDVEMWYNESGEVYPIAYSVSQVEKLKKYWNREGKKLMAEREFLPSPNENACKYCNVRSDKGGVCHAWKKL